MPAVRGEPAQTPCVRCGVVPTMAFCHAGAWGLTGRVCETHADELADAGYAIASDGSGRRAGVVMNWGSA